MKFKAIVYGKKGCSLCDNRKQNLERFPAQYKKSAGKDIEIDIQSVDISTVDGLVSFCMEDRTNSDIPVVILEDVKGNTLKSYHGPTAVVSTRDLMEVFDSAAG